jgi:putative Mg2+ transporter-C (MgtC) family protein
MVLPDDLVKLLLAVLVGGLIGAEREFRDKSAGFRTMIFICIGATFFTIFSARLGGTEDPVRIAASIVSGIGFLGAGAILRSGDKIKGLTTAATIWLVAALGMGIGGGQYAAVTMGTVATLIVLWFFPWLEIWIDRTGESRTYEVICPIRMEKFDELERLLRQHRLKLRGQRKFRSGETMTCVWEATGRREGHDAVTAQLFADPEVLEFHF